MGEVLLGPSYAEEFVVNIPPRIGWTSGAGNISGNLTFKKKSTTNTVRDIIKNKIESGIEDAFYVADLGALVRQHRKWQRLLPRVVSTIPPKKTYHG